MTTDCVACQNIKAGLCPACGHLHDSAPCLGPAVDPIEPGETCGCYDSRDHYLMHPHHVCQENMTTYSYYSEPDYRYCINAVVHGFNRCWVHLSWEQKREYYLMKAEKFGAGNGAVLI